MKTGVSGQVLGPKLVQNCQINQNCSKTYTTNYPKLGMCYEGRGRPKIFVDMCAFRRIGPRTGGPQRSLVEQKLEASPREPLILSFAVCIGTKKLAGVGCRPPDPPLDLGWAPAPQIPRWGGCRPPGRSQKRWVRPGGLRGGSPPGSSGGSGGRQPSRDHLLVPVFWSLLHRGLVHDA